MYNNYNLNNRQRDRTRYNSNFTNRQRDRNEDRTLININDVVDTIVNMSKTKFIKYAESLAERTSESASSVRKIYNQIIKSIEKEDMELLMMLIPLMNSLLNRGVLKSKDIVDIVTKVIKPRLDKDFKDKDVKVIINRLKLFLEAVIAYSKKNKGGDQR